MFCEEPLIDFWFDPGLLGAVKYVMCLDEVIWFQLLNCYELAVPNRRLLMGRRRTATGSAILPCSEKSSVHGCQVQWPERDRPATIASSLFIICSMLPRNAVPGHRDQLK
ncbi:hypothetical protein RB195_012650 [Necator americanus]|uniref:Uncharacterized protein n=1 Tax=Necator americanus TaxID=51031 RepID=A0ABR1DT32_NECAM